MKERIEVRDLKATAWSLLKGKWKKGVIINLILFGILLGTGILRGMLEVLIDVIVGESIFSIVASVAIGFVAMGIYHGGLLGWTASFYRFVKAESDLCTRNYKEFIVDKFKRSFFYGITYSFFIIIWIIGFYFIGLVCIVLISKISSGILALLLLIIGIIAFVCGISICILKYIQYSMARYILIDRPDIKIREALKESKRLISGYKANYVSMCLSFLGWIILVVLTFGIAGLWVGSYFATTEALFYKKLKEIKNSLGKSSVDMDEFMTGVEIK